MKKIIDFINLQLLFLKKDIKIFLSNLQVINTIVKEIEDLMSKNSSLDLINVGPVNGESKIKLIQNADIFV